MFGWECVNEEWCRNMGHVMICYIVFLAFLISLFLSFLLLFIVQNWVVYVSYELVLNLLIWLWVICISCCVVGMFLVPSNSLLRFCVLFLFERAIDSVYMDVSP
ncbi:hypothetical protein BDZ91DRAFT_401391 [Kalaharituber pfeilii]|nr:hypothetical protein BDZ91DRAFT_401391 [Kalaharituber pfeilii]